MYTLKRDFKNEALRKLPSKGMWGVWDGDVMVRCPNCGTVSNCKNHTILADRQVTPSFVCGNKRCDFHEYVELTNFEPIPAKGVGDTENGV